MRNKLRNKIEKLAAERPVTLSFLVLMSAALIVIPASIPFYVANPQGFASNVMSEAYGTLFDLLIIGWLLLWLNKLADLRQRKNRYREEIEDMLGWHSPEAAHRIAGNIRRLNRSGVLQDIRLTEAYLCGANLAEASMRGSDLWGANLERTTLRLCDLRGANLAGVNLCEADLEQALVRGADARGANFREADLERADFEEANLGGADLTGADLQYTSLTRANLERANLQGANLHGTILQGTNLEKACLRESNLLSANLREANLKRADLCSAHLVRADLRGAHLTGADFRGANLSGIRLPEGEGPAALADVATLFNARLDPAHEEWLRRHHPRLFEDPETPVPPRRNGEPPAERRNQAAPKTSAPRVPADAASLRQEA